MRVRWSGLGAQLLASTAAMLVGSSCSSPRASAAQQRSAIPIPVADHHQHLFSPATQALISTPQGSVPVITARDLVALLDSAGIRRALVLSMGYTWGSPNRNVPDEYEKVRADHDWTSAQVAMYPDRLRAFCGLNPLREYALRELDRCAADPQLRRGLKLHFANSVVALNDTAHVAQLRRVFASANRHRMPIVAHIRSSISRGLPYGGNEARIFLEQILPMAPDVVVQIAHMAGAGGYADTTVDAAMAVFSEAFARRDPRVRNVYFDVATVAGRGPEINERTARLMTQRIREIGVDRFFFGSDAAAPPNLAPRESWALFLKLPLTREEFATIAGNVAPYLK
jgi:predicted TIM-barrel fold metal-dependent hydrolase